MVISLVVSSVSYFYCLQEGGSGNGCVLRVCFIGSKGCEAFRAVIGYFPTKFWQGERIVDFHRSKSTVLLH